MPLSDRKGWSQDPTLPCPHLRVGGGGKGICLEISAYLRPSVGKQIFLLCFCICGFCMWACSHLLQPGTLPLYYYCCIFHHVIVLQALNYTDNIFYNTQAADQEKLAKEKKKNNKEMFMLFLFLFVLVARLSLCSKATNVKKKSFLVNFRYLLLFFLELNF